MPKVRRSSYNLAFKLKVVAEAEAVENNSEIARDYGISESMVRRWRKDQANLFNGELKMSAKRKTMGCFSPKYPELDQTLLDWFSEQRSQGKSFVSLKQWKASISWYLSDRVAMFTQTVGMTASDWPVFHVVKFRILLSTRKFFLAKILGYKPNPLPWREFTCSQFNLLEKSLGL